MSLSTNLWRGSVWAGSVWNGGVGLPGWSPTDISQAEADALKAFWQATGGSGWTNPWVFGTLANDLYGVTVSGGKVTVIAVGDNNLDTDDANLDMSVFELTEAGVNAVLSSLVSSSGTNGTLDISGSAEPSATGVGHITTLLSRGWVITVSSADVTVVSGTTHIATKDGEAMFFHDSIPFSNVIHAGELVTLEDSAGVKATAYAFTQGGGESLGNELTTNGDFARSDGWTSTATWVIADGKASINTGLTLQSMRQPITVTNGSLYKLEVDVLSYVKGTCAISSTSVWGITKNLSQAVGSNTVYLTCFDASHANGHRLTTMTAAAELSIDNVSVRKILEIPSSGLRLISTPNGPDRNMASIGTGFNPNDIVKVSVGA